ncbi:MAG: hypothetical protein O2887_03860 [Bacteroidetes bacterium]|nr:hypothetical protein [Bacteroidota bacterium]MDA1119622.1 hypothetical protein [Bacteroidota bacterium]
MRLAYLVAWDFSKESGVSTKIFAQCEFFKKALIETTIFCISKNPPSYKFIPQGVNIVHLKTTWFNFPFIFYLVYQRIKEYKPDCIYIRSLLLKPGILKIFDLAPSIYEFNTNESMELRVLSQRSLKDFIKFIYHHFSYKFYLKRLTGLVTVTNELYQIYKRSFLKIPIIVVPNSIDLSKYEMIEDERVDHEINLLFMGSEAQPWQGVDILSKLALNVPNNFVIHVIGYTADEESPNNLKFYGYLEKEEYKKIVAKCDIGIGTMALYRKNMNEACPLKVREYLAYGMPCIIAYTDTAFIDNLPEWILQIPNTEDGIIEMKDDLINFCLRMKGRRLTHEEVAPYIDSSIIEKKRIEFFKSFSNVDVAS